MNLNIEKISTLLFIVEPKMKGCALPGLEPGLELIT